MITEDELEALVGTPFPGGTYTVEPYTNWLTCDCVLAPELAAVQNALNTTKADFAKVKSMAGSNADQETDGILTSFDSSAMVTGRAE